MQSVQCLECKHYTGVNQCDAYPLGIPQIIFIGEHDHKEPYPGDKGIQFEPIKEPVTNA